MSIDAVKCHLSRWGREQDVLEFARSSATVELAALAVGVIPARIAKTLSFKAEHGCLLLVTAGDSRVDNGKFKARFGCKARMPSAMEVPALTGHAVGGVCPFSLPVTGVDVYLDVSLKRFSTVFPACGSDNSAIELRCEELYVYALAKDWVDVCKDWADDMAG